MYNILMVITYLRTSPNIFGLLPQYIALGNFSIHALPKGKIIKKENGQYKIQVTDIFLFVYDSFNFDGDQFLGTWDDENMESLTLSPESKFIGNINFREFRELTGYGLDFPILSPLRKINDFE